MPTPSHLMRDPQILDDPEIEQMVGDLMSCTPEAAASYFFPTPVRITDPIRMTTEHGETPRQAYVLAALLRRLTSEDSRN